MPDEHVQLRYNVRRFARDRWEVYRNGAWVPVADLDSRLAQELSNYVDMRDSSTGVLEFKNKEGQWEGKDKWGKALLDFTGEGAPRPAWWPKDVPWPPMTAEKKDAQGNVTVPSRFDNAEYLAVAKVYGQTVHAAGLPKPETYTDPQTGERWERDTPEGAWHRVPGLPQQSFQTFEKAEQWLAQTPGTEKFQAKLDPQSGRFVVVPRTETPTPKTMQELLTKYVARAIVDGNWDTANQLWAFQNQPSGFQRLQAAIDLSRSPADYFTVLGMMRGQIPISPDATGYPKLPQSEAFSFFGMGTGQDKGQVKNALPASAAAQGAPATATITPQEAGAPVPPVITGPGGVPIPRPGPTQQFGAAQGVGPTGTQFGPGVGFSPEEGMFTTALPDAQALERMRIRTPSLAEGFGVPRVNTGMQAPGGQITASMGGSEFGQSQFLDQSDPYRGNMAFEPDVDGATRAIQAAPKVPPSLGETAFQGDMQGPSFTSRPSLGETAFQGDIQGPSAPVVRRAGFERLPPTGNRIADVRNYIQNEPGLSALRTVGLEGGVLQPAKQLTEFGALTFPSMQAWTRMTPPEREMFQRAVESQGFDWPTYLQQWQATIPGGRRRQQVSFAGERF